MLNFTILHDFKVQFIRQSLSQQTLFYLNFQNKKNNVFLRVRILIEIPNMLL